MNAVTVMKIKCPVCGKKAAYEGNLFRPFCSERCSLIDLGKWADEKYSIGAGEEGKESERDRCHRVFKTKRRGA